MKHRILTKEIYMEYIMDYICINNEGKRFEPGGGGFGKRAFWWIGKHNGFTVETRLWTHHLVNLRTSPVFCHSLENFHLRWYFNWALSGESCVPALSEASGGKKVTEHNNMPKEICLECGLVHTAKMETCQTNIVEWTRSSRKGGTGLPRPV